MHSSIIAWRYFTQPQSKSFLTIIPKAATLGLALSLVVLLCTLSVMNGFERDIRLNVLSKMPHVMAVDAQDKDIDYESALIEKKETFFQTKMLVSQWNYEQVSVIFTPSVTEPTLSSSLMHSHHRYKLNQPLTFICFSSKKVFGKPVSVAHDMTFKQKREDDSMSVYLPLEYKSKFKELILYPMVGYWLKDPFMSAPLTQELRNKYPTLLFVSWDEHYASLFDALHSEKRLLFVILSLLILLIYAQLALTMLLLFKEKEKDMIPIFFFKDAKKSLRILFYSYGFLNVILGLVLGCFGGWWLSLRLPRIVQSIEEILGITFLPYSQYYSSSLPSVFQLSDLIQVGVVTFVIGGLVVVIVVEKTLARPIQSLLREYQ